MGARCSARRAASSILTTVIGLGAALWAWLRARGRPEAENWGRLGLMILFGAIMAVLVIRSLAVAHAYMVPAFAALALAFWRWGDAGSKYLAPPDRNAVPFAVNSDDCHGVGFQPFVAESRVSDGGGERQQPGLSVARASGACRRTSGASLCIDQYCADPLGQHAAQRGDNGPSPQPCDDQSRPVGLSRAARRGAALRSAREGAISGVLRE